LPTLYLISPAGPDLPVRLARAYVTRHAGTAVAADAACAFLAGRPAPSDPKKIRDRAATKERLRLRRLGEGLLERWCREALGPAATDAAIIASIRVMTGRNLSPDTLQRRRQLAADFDRAMGAHSPLDARRTDLTELHRAQRRADNAISRLERCLRRGAAPSRQLVARAHRAEARHYEQAASRLAWTPATNAAGERIQLSVEELRALPLSASSSPSGAQRRPDAAVTVRFAHDLSRDERAKYGFADQAA
jgi:hypothetical protein